MQNFAYVYMRALAPLTALALSLYIAASPLGRLQAENDRLKPVRIDMTKTLAYMPVKVTVVAGDTVEWKNLSPVEHTVTADPAIARNREHVRLPGSAEPFNSGSIVPGKTYRYRFTVPGRYRYFSIPHETSGMVGEIVVQPSGA